LDAAARARLLLDLGRALTWVGDARASFAAMAEAATVAESADERSLFWLARLGRSFAQALVEPHAKPTEEIRAELEQAMGVFEELGDDAGLATVWEHVAEVEWMPCRFEAAERAARRSVEHARRAGDEQLVSDALIRMLAAQCFGVATPQVGMATLVELRDDLSRTRTLEAMAMVVRGRYRAMEGEIDEARRLIALAAEVTEALGLRFHVAAHEEELGYVELHAGDAVAAEQAFRRNYEILDGLGDEGHKSTGAAGLARALCALGRYDEADRYASLAREVAAEDDVASQAIGRSAQALVASARGEHADAERLAREAVRIYAEAGAEAPQFVGDAWMDLAEVLRSAGRRAEAAEAAREALVLFERKGDRPTSDSARAFIDALGS
jgi:tetratricopeptide (TPR) repeat protein